MGHPNMNCMYVNVWVHEMEIDMLFDFLNDRVSVPPKYWLSEAETPMSLSSYLMVSLPYDSYSNLRSMCGIESNKI